MGARILAHRDQIVLDKLFLPAFGSYAAAAGATVEAGEASLKTRARIRGERIELDNDLLLDAFDISLGNPSAFEQAFGMPIDLALALLRDPFGRINLSIFVKVDEVGAGVGVAGIVRTAVRQALIGALAAPLKLAGLGLSGAGTLVGVGGKKGFSMDPLLAPAGSQEPTNESRQRLAGFAKLLAERPGVAITVRGRAGPADALTNPSSEAVAALAMSRAERVRALLLEAGADPDRVAVGEPVGPGDPGVLISLGAD